MTAQEAGQDALTLALERLRLEGAIFLRAEYSERWTLEGQGGPMFAGLMHPGAERLILFHVIAEGRCWVSRPGGDRYWAGAGDVLVLPYGDAHLMGGLEQTAPNRLARRGCGVAADRGPSRTSGQHSGCPARLGQGAPGPGVRIPVEEPVSARTGDLTDPVRAGLANACREGPADHHR